MKNSRNYDMRICVESICRGALGEIGYAKSILRDCFSGDCEEFRVYFGLKKGCKAMELISN